jgi:hypothetical protein
MTTWFFNTFFLTVFLSVKFTPYKNFCQKKQLLADILPYWLAVVGSGSGPTWSESASLAASPIVTFIAKSRVREQRMDPKKRHSTEARSTKKLRLNRC